jgi:hypothetical protein
MQITVGIGGIPMKSNETTVNPTVSKVRKKNGMKIFLTAIMVLFLTS